MGLADRWRSYRRRQWLESVDEAHTGVTLFDKHEYTPEQVEAFVEKCRLAGYQVGTRSFSGDGGRRDGSYRVYARRPGEKDPRLPGEPGFLPLGDLRGAPPEYQAMLLPDYHHPLEEAERLEREQREDSS
jgi:hypothetical protein